MKLLTIFLVIFALTGLSMAGSTVDKESPMGTVSQLSPLVTWKVTLETDTGGDASYTVHMDGLLYSIDTLDLDLNKSTSVVVKILEPYEKTVQTVDVYTVGNNTTYPLDGDNMYVLMGDLQISITNGAEGYDVPVYITVKR